MARPAITPAAKDSAILFRLLVVLTLDEVDLVLSEMDGAPLLVCSHLYGSGPRLRMK